MINTLFTMLIMFGSQAHAKSEKVYYTIANAKKLCYAQGLKEKKEITSCIKDKMKNNYIPERKTASKKK